MDVLGLKGLGEILVAGEAYAWLVHLDLLRLRRAESHRQGDRRENPIGHLSHLLLPSLAAARMTCGAIAFRKWRMHVLLHHPGLLRSMRLMAENAIQALPAL